MSTTPLSIKLRSALAAKGMKQADVIRAFPEVSPAIVGHWFQGKRQPGLDNLRKLAAILDVSAAELIADDPDTDRDQGEVLADAASDDRAPWWLNVRRALKSRNVSARQLATELGVAEVSVFSWLNGKREPPLETIRTLCERAGLTLAAAVEGERTTPVGNPPPGTDWVTDQGEREMLAAWRAMPPAKRLAMLLLCRT